MLSLREQQQQFEQDLFAGVGTKRKQRQNNNYAYKRKQFPAAFDAALKEDAKSSDQDTKTVELTYLYDTKNSHPIIEFKPSKEELRAASITPSFVLEVMWPRVVQFYHPSSPHCKDFQSTYVNLARSVKRRSSRLPVEFYAVNCGIYRDVCDQGFQVKTVPSFIGLKSGSIEGKQLSLPGDNEGKVTSKEDIMMDVDEKVEYIAEVLGFTLDAVKGHSSAYVSNVANNKAQFSGTRAANMPSSASSGLLECEQVFQDATSSFLVTISSSIYSKHPHDSSLPLDDSHKLAEFLDLLRWAFPPETEVHTLAEELKQEFLSITLGEGELLKVLSRHMDLAKGVSWSERCKNSDPYSCGIWSLIHIISIGVAERHASVVGDAERVTIQHAGRSIRFFIDAFFIGCDSCKKSWIELYDEACCGLHNTDHQPRGEEQWKQLAVWIWEVHNEINIRRQRYKSPTTLLWPRRKDCPKCWPSEKENGLTITDMESFDKEALYNYLKKTYWISGHHNNRLVLIDRWSKAKRALSVKRLRERMASREFSMVGALVRLLFFFVVLRVAIQLCTRWNIQARRIKRRSDAEINDRGDNDDEPSNYNRSKSFSTTRSRRSGNASNRWPMKYNNTSRPSNITNTSRRHRSETPHNRPKPTRSPLHL
jgi:hypothetical protein